MHCCGLQIHDMTMMAKLHACNGDELEVDSSDDYCWQCRGGDGDDRLCYFVGFSWNYGNPLLSKNIRIIMQVLMMLTMMMLMTVMLDFNGADV